MEKIKADKNQEIDRLKQSVNELRSQLTSTKKDSDNKLTNCRIKLVEETNGRIEHVRTLTKAIEEALLAEIQSLNETIRKKDSEIQYLIDCDRKSMAENEEIQHGLKDHIRRLQDKIFVLQRENEIELFKTVDRMKKAHD